MDNGKPDDATPQPPSARTSRGFRRFLPSCTAIVVALFLMIPWILIAVPGARVDAIGFAISYRVYGWPYSHANDFQAVSVIQAVYSGRDLILPQTTVLACKSSTLPEKQLGVTDGGRFWSDLENWFYTGGNTLNWDWWNLTANFCIGLAIYLLLVIVLEFRIRKRGSLLRISVLEGLVGVTLLALLLAIPIYERHGAENDAKVLARLEPVLAPRDRVNLGKFGTNLDMQSRLPIWLERLFDYRSQETLRRIFPESDWKRVVSVRMILANENDTPEEKQEKGEFDAKGTHQLSAALGELPHLQAITLSVQDVAQLDFLNRIRPNGIRILSIEILNPMPGEVAEFRFLRRFSNLESLSIREIRTDGLDSVATEVWKSGLLENIGKCHRLNKIRAPNLVLNRSDCNSILRLRSLKLLECGFVSESGIDWINQNNPELKINLVPFHGRIRTRMSMW